jgi:hypothetical protein
MQADIDKIAFAFGKVLWGLKEMTEEEVKAKAKGFAEELPFPVDVETICQEVAKGYAQAEAEHQQQRAPLH